MQGNQQPQELYDIYDLIYVPFWQTQNFRILLLLLAFTLIAGAIWWLWRNKKVRVVPPWEEALERLNKLEPYHENANLFYEQLTYSVKRYLERRYHHTLSSKTDEEVSLIELASSSTTQPEIQKLFKRAVNYKFGKLKTTVEQMIEDKERAIRFVQETVPQETRKQT
jgi:hypothetical protein